VGVVARRDDVSATPGRFGWAGGYGIYRRRTLPTLPHFIRACRDSACSCWVTTSCPAKRSSHAGRSFQASWVRAGHGTFGIVMRMLPTKNEVVRAEKIGNMKVNNRYVSDEDKQLKAIQTLLKQRVLRP
jgi:hypothetical protein